MCRAKVFSGISHRDELWGVGGDSWTILGENGGWTVPSAMTPWLLFALQPRMTTMKIRTLCTGGPDLRCIASTCRLHSEHQDPARCQVGVSHRLNAADIIRSYSPMTVPNERQVQLI